MATEIGKAYVQIVPSARGIKSGLENALGDEIPGAGESAGNIFSSSFISTFGKVFSAAAVGKVLKDAFSEGASLEQSLGGVETLFKENADTVVSYARDAYETAGLSANEYMENVTGFSATLLQGLGGDTERAADIANQAMIDMSDNANKFGTDISSIQNAYQGFAKQNYTMLDNLKLGYGGTQAEMARLINDSGVLGDSIEVTSDTVNDVPFDKIIEAINVIQGDLGITGTTAKEAAQTFSGSFAAMKASAKNLLGDMAAGTGDITRDVDALAKTANTFVTGNFLPMLGNVVSSFDDLTGKARTVKTVIEGIGAAILVIKAQSVVNAATSAITGLIGNLGKATAAVKAFAMANPAAVVGTAVIAAVTAVSIAIDNATDKIDEVVDGYDSLSDAQKELVDSSETALKSINNNIEQRKTSAKEVENEAAAYETLKDRLYELDDAEVLDTETKAQMAAIVEELNGSIPNMNIAIDETTGHLKTNRSEIDKSIDSYKNYAIAQAAQERMVDIAKDLAEAEKTAREDEEAFQEALKNRDDIQKQINENLEKWEELRINDGSGVEMTALLDEVETLKVSLSEAEDAVGELSIAYTQSSEKVKTLNSELDETAEAAKGAETSVDSLGGGLEKTYEKVEMAAITIGNATVRITQDTYDSIQKIQEAYNQAVEDRTSEIMGSMNLFEKFPEVAETSATELFSAMESNKAALDEWSTGIAELAERGISEGLLKELEDAGPSSLTEIRALRTMSGPELEKYSGLWEETYETSREAAERELAKMKDASEEEIGEILRQADIYDDKMYSTYLYLGKTITDGMAQGIIDGTATVCDAISFMDAEAQNTTREENRIQSPSRVYRELGAYISEGFALGIDDGADSVFRSIKGLTDQLEFKNNANDIISRYNHFELSRSSGESSKSTFRTDKSGVIELRLVDGAGAVIAKATVDPLDIYNGQRIALANRGVTV